jgi:hypothetical protein
MLSGSSLGALRELVAVAGIHKNKFRGCNQIRLDPVQLFCNLICVQHKMVGDAYPSILQCLVYCKKKQFITGGYSPVHKVALFLCLSNLLRSSPWTSTIIITFKWVSPFQILIQLYGLACMSSASSLCHFLLLSSTVVKPSSLLLLVLSSLPMLDNNQELIKPPLPITAMKLPLYLLSGRGTQKPLLSMHTSSLLSSMILFSLMMMHPTSLATSLIKFPPLPMLGLTVLPAFVFFSPLHFF